MPALPALLRHNAGTAGGHARRIVGVGHKMYLTYHETVAWLEGLLQRSEDLAGVDLFVLPSFLALDRANTLLGTRGIFLGAQDMHWQDRGAFTGEVSPLSLAELGCTFVEIGHAERRALFGETDEVVGLKTAAALAHGLVPIICVGESSIIDESSAIACILGQVRAALSAVPAEAAARPIIVAYEPVWAIGAAASAPVTHIASVIAAIRHVLTQKWRGPSAILYGGSVRQAQANAIVEVAEADGVFVGRAALDLDELCAIIQGVARAV